MQVVGAGALQEYWKTQPAAEAPLRAFHALLEEAAWPSLRAMADDLGEMAIPADDAVDVAFAWCGARVRLKVNFDVGVVVIDAVSKRKETAT